eukprot:4871116-Amphidinium_carterae.3
MLPQNLHLFPIWEDGFPRGVGWLPLTNDSQVLGMGSVVHFPSNYFVLSKRLQYACGHEGAIANTPLSSNASAHPLNCHCHSVPFWSSLLGSLLFR